jgi:O-antigen/teichoic acid export membrane protein
MSVRRSLTWTYLAQTVGFFVTFGSTLVVARLVNPRDFGIFAMANAVATIINVFMHFGLARYLTRETFLSRETLRSVFTVNVMMSSLYASLLLIGSIESHRLFASPELGRFLFVFAVFPLIGMMEFVPSAMCLREMRFGVIGTLAVVRAIVLACVTMLLAFQGFAYMSFAWAQVIAWLTTTICYNIIVWRPDAWRLRFKGIRSIVHFGAQMIGINGVSQLSARGGEMTLGSMLGLTSLGLFTRASGLPTSLYSTVYSAGSDVIFSRLSRDLRETGELHHTYLRFMRLILGLLWPMLFGLAVLAQPVIHILYGAKWQAAATPLALIAIAYAVTVGIGMTSELFILRHETRRQVRIEGLRAATGFLMFAGGAMISLTAAAAAKVAEGVLASILYRKPMMQMIGAPQGELRRVYLEGLMLSAAATLPALALMTWMHWSERTSLVAVVSSTALGGVLWLVLLFHRQHPIAVEFMRVLNRKADEKS